MYSGGLVAGVGSAVVVGGPFVFLVVLLGAIFIRRAEAEDKLMAEQFPKEYPAYMKNTKKLIPFISKDVEMNNLNIRAARGITQLAIAITAFLFVPAWMLDYWQAWVFLVVFFIGVITITAYLMKNDKTLLERRVNAGPSFEKEKSQKNNHLLYQHRVCRPHPCSSHRPPAWKVADADLHCAVGRFPRRARLSRGLLCVQVEHLCCVHR